MDVIVVGHEWDDCETNICLFSDWDKAEKYLAKYCVQEWDSNKDNKEESLTGSDREIIDSYYGGTYNEWYFMERHEIDQWNK